MKKFITASVVLLVQFVFIGNRALAQDSTVTVPREASAASQESIHLKSFIVPAALLGYGFVSLDSRALRNFDHYLNEQVRASAPHFATHADDYLQFVPLVAVYGLDLAGVKAKNNFIDRTAMLLISETLMGQSVGLLKRGTNRLRPNAVNRYSFPSGHTATAFVSAEFMSQEYRDLSPWYSAAGYAVAAGTGALRMYNNAHWFSDVIGGAGLGILSTKLAYLAYPYIKHKLFGDKALSFIAVPAYREGMTEICLIKVFR